MVELFRKAAKHYPLKINSSDWNEVLNKLSCRVLEGKTPELNKIPIVWKKFFS